MGELASFGAPGFESWALEVWKSGLAWSCSHGHLLIKPHGSIKEDQNITAGDKHCSQNCALQGSYYRFTMAFLRTKLSHKEMIKIRLI